MIRKLKSSLILLVGLAMAYWFVSRLNWSSVGAHLRNAQIWPLLLAATLINLTMAVRSLRWRAFLSPIAKTGFGNLFAATSVGFGAIFVIGRTGEIVRPAVLSLRERLRPSATFATILIERVYDSTAIISLFAVNLLFLKLPPQQASDGATLEAIRSIGLILLLGVIAGISILILLRLKAGSILGWMERRSGRFPRKLVQPAINFVRHLAEGLSVLLNLRELAVTVFHTICVWTLVCSATWLTLFAFGLKFPVSYVLFILGFGLVGSVVPTPGGSAGAFHAVTAKGFEFLGLEPNLAASIAIVYHLIAFGPPFFIGLYYLIRDDISFKQLREMISSENEDDNRTQEEAGARKADASG